MRLFQLNLQRSFGGAEAYTAFCCRAFARLGLDTTLLIHPDAKYWHKLDLGARTQCIEVVSDAQLIDVLALSRAPAWLVTHGPLPDLLKQKHTGLLVTGFAHMPVQGRDPVRAYGGYDMLFPVSEWVRTGLSEQGIPVWPTPIYGVADVVREGAAAEIYRTSQYDWDRRKMRDRVLAYAEPIWNKFAHHPRFVKRPGISLGIVSRITPIKQLPLMFSHLASVLAQHPSINLEIFGSGGYASLRDLRKALQPAAAQVRFWGHQRNVAAIYAQMDYLLTGLPEKEALGLNVIEAQACGTPVLAVNAPPFTETVIDQQTGYLFTDPRQDGGADFGRLLTQLENTPRPDPQRAAAHLERFSFDAFVERLRPVADWGQAQLRQT